MKVVAGLAETLKGYRGEAELLIEISAGAGAVIGDTFEEIAEIIHHPKLSAKGGSRPWREKTSRRRLF